MFCSKCGSPIPDGYKFCSKCGTPVAANIAPQAPAQPAPAPAPSPVPEAAPAQPAPAPAPAPVPEAAPAQPAPAPAPAPEAAPAQPVVAPVPEAPQYTQPQYTQPQYTQPQPQYAQPAAPQYAQPYQYTQPAPAKKPVNKKLIGIIAGVAVAVILAVVLIIVLGGGAKGGKGAGSYKDAALGFMNAIYQDWDAEKAISYIPDAIVEAELEEEDMTRKEYIKEGNETFKELKESLHSAFGKKCSISTKVTDSDKYDKDDLEDLNDDLKDEYGKKIGKVTEAYDVEVEMTISYKLDGDKKEISNDVTVVVGKIGGRWYVINGGGML